MSTNRHLKRIILTILLMVSVFFVFSCGEPTYISLPEITIQPDTASISSKTDENFIFSVSCKDVDGEMAKIKDGPGLILACIIFKDSESEYVTYINNGNLFSIVSDYNTSVQYGLFANSNNVLYSTTMVYGESKLVKQVKLLEGSNVGAPTYHYNFNKRTSLNSEKVTMQLYSYNTDNCKIKLIDANNTEKIFTITNKGDYQQNDKIHICLFASLTPGTGNFSNLFFSTLSYIGTFTAQIP